MNKMTQKLIWSAVAALVGVIAGLAMHKALDVTWKKVRHKKPPKKPGRTGVEWSDAIAWSAFSGITSAFAKMVINELAARGWMKATGRKPPED